MGYPEAQLELHNPVTGRSDRDTYVNREEYPHNSCYVDIVFSWKNFMGADGWIK